MRMKYEPDHTSISKGRYFLRAINSEQMLYYIVFVLLFCLPPIFLNSGYYLNVLGTMAIFTILAFSLNLIMGYAGQISLGHAGLFATGAYVTSILTTDYHISPVLGLVAGTLVGAFAGFLIALPSLRVSEVYLALVTLAFGIVIHGVVYNWDDVTGGFNGIPGIPNFGVRGFTFSTFQYYWLIVFVLLIVMIFNWLLIKSRWGQSLVSIRESELAADTFGIRIIKTKLMVFTISSGMAGLAGALFAHLTNYISPESFTFDVSLEILLMCILGGMATMIGPLIGAMVLTVIPLLFNNAPEFQVLIYGLLILIFMNFLPGGLIGKVEGKISRSSRFSEGLAATNQESLNLLSPQNRRSKLKVSGVTKQFGGLVAVDNVSFEIDSGEVVGIIGPNGSGKTTLVNIISGVYNPNSGKICIDDNDMTGNSPSQIAKLGLSRTFQNLRLFENMSVIENIIIGGSAKLPIRFWSSIFFTSVERKHVKQLKDAAIHIMRMLQIEDIAERRVNELPYGKKKMVEIARALIGSPSFLLLDEPIAGLTDEEVREVTVAIRNIAEHGTGILLIEHNVGWVATLCNRILVLDEGKVISRGTPKEILSDPKVIEAYMGDIKYEAEGN